MEGRMLKVTKDNVTKLSEDALYIELGRISEKDLMYSLIEAELDRRCEVQSQMLAKRHLSQLESLKVTQAIQAEIAQIFEGFKGAKTIRLIENLGQDMIDDYTVCEVTFTVTSKLTQAFEHNLTSWECDSIEMANRKRAVLIYHRLYNKFMRDATKENLDFLKRVLG